MNQRVKKWRQHAGYAAFLLALVFLTTRTCRSESASTDIRFRVGQAGATLRGLEADLYRPGEDEVIGFYRRDFPQGSGSGAGQWTVRADPGLYRMKIALRTTAGIRSVERGLEIFDGAIVTIDLERDLVPDPPATTAR